MPTERSEFEAGDHYTCTSVKDLEDREGFMPYSGLMPEIRDKLGREPADRGELVIVAEQVIYDRKRRDRARERRRGRRGF
jgi:hypothetical protein